MDISKNLYDSDYSDYHGRLKTNPPYKFDIGYVTFNENCQIFLHITEKSKCYDTKIKIYGGVIFINNEYYYVMGNNVPIEYSCVYEKYFPAYINQSISAKITNLNITNYAEVAFKSLINVQKINLNASCLYPNTNCLCQTNSCRDKCNKNKNIHESIPAYYSGCSHTLFYSKKSHCKNLFLESLKSTIIPGLSGMVIIVYLKDFIKVVGVVIYIEKCKKFYIALTNNKVFLKSTRFNKSYYNEISSRCEIPTIIHAYCDYLTK